MGFQRVYSGAQEGPLITFNYTDVADGTGIREFYAGFSLDASGEITLLDQNTFYSNDIETSTLTSSGTFTDILNKTFSLNSFNLPQIARGEARLECCVTMNPDVGDDVGAYYVEATIYNNAVSIGNASCAIQTSTAGVSKVTNLLLPITLTETKYKAGDQLKMKVSFYVRKVSGSGSNLEFAIGHDPQDRDGTYLTPSTSPFHFTTMILKMPFRIDS